MKRFFLILAFLALRSLALFEDQALKFDWRQQYIGFVEDVKHFHSSKSKDVLLVRTKSNVLAALDGDRY